MSNRMRLVLALLLLAGSAHAQMQQPPQSGARTFYDAMGRTTGTASTSGNVTTFRDSMGRLTGTAERLPDGRVEYRDAMGRLTGTSSK